MTPFSYQGTHSIYTNSIRGFWSAILAEAKPFQEQVSSKQNTHWNHLPHHSKEMIVLPLIRSLHLCDSFDSGLVGLKTQGSVVKEAFSYVP